MKPVRSTQSRVIPEEKIRELVQKRAFELCQKRGNAPGNDWSDWFEAEKQIRKELHLER
jgi:hypothetical protein